MPPFPVPVVAQVSDGIIAGGYEPEAIEILKQKVRRAH